MKRIFLALMTLLLISLSLGYNTTQIETTSQSEVNVSTSYNETYSSTNSSDYNLKLKQTGSSCSTDTNESINIIEQNDRKVSFSGKMTAANPCATIEPEIQKEENSYVLNLQTSSDEGVCIQCIGSIGYKTDIEFENPYNLTIKHNNETVRTINSSDFETSNTNVSKGSQKDIESSSDQTETDKVNNEDKNISDLNSSKDFEKQIEQERKDFVSRMVDWIDNFL